MLLLGVVRRPQLYPSPHALTPRLITIVLATRCSVISTLCALLSHLDPDKTEFRNTMDQLNDFMDDYELETDHRVRLRHFFRSTRVFARRSSCTRTPSPERPLASVPLA